MPSGPREDDADPWPPPPPPPPPLPDLPDAIPGDIVEGGDYSDVDEEEDSDYDDGEEAIPVAVAVGAQDASGGDRPPSPPSSSSTLSGAIYAGEAVLATSIGRIGGGEDRWPPEEEGGVSAPDSYDAVAVAIVAAADDGGSSEDGGIPDGGGRMRDRPGTASVRSGRSRIRIARRTEDPGAPPVRTPVQSERVIVGGQIETRIATTHFNADGSERVVTTHHHADGSVVEESTSQVADVAPVPYGEGPVFPAPPPASLSDDQSADGFELYGEIPVFLAPASVSLPDDQSADGFELDDFYIFASRRRRRMVVCVVAGLVFVAAGVAGVIVGLAYRWNKTSPEATVLVPTHSPSAPWRGTPAPTAPPSLSPTEGGPAEARSVGLIAGLAAGAVGLVLMVCLVAVRMRLVRMRKMEPLPSRQFQPFPPSRPTPWPTPSAGLHSNNETHASDNLTREEKSDEEAYSVVVPDRVRPGQDFKVKVGDRVVTVRCPLGSGPGRSLRITVKKDIALPPPGQATGPILIEGGEQSETDGNMRRVDRTLPILTEGPGVSQTRRSPPPEGRSSGASGQSSVDLPPSQAAETHTFEVVVPRGVRPGRSFTVLADGVRVSVPCPPNVTPGRKVVFHLSSDILREALKLAGIRLRYGKLGGWARSVRLEDMKFRWLRTADGPADDETRRGYVRKLEVLRRGRGARLSLVPADDPGAGVECSVRGGDGITDLVSAAEIVSAQGGGALRDRAAWFRDKCALLAGCGGGTCGEGPVQLCVRRDRLVADSLEAVMALRRADLRRPWLFQLVDGVDPITVTAARDWAQLLMESLLDPDMGLWQSNMLDRSCVQVNPASEIACREDHLLYFHFFGRIMGKALYDGQQAKGRTVQHLYKHILGWPVTFADLKAIDEEFYNKLERLMDMDPELVENLSHRFTAVEERMGVTKEVMLVPGGNEIKVTKNNLHNYMEECLKYKMMGQVKEQLAELLLGFFEVVPEPLLTVFDFEELELLIHGI